LSDKIITDRDVLRQISKPTTWEEVRRLCLVSRLKRANGTAWTEGVGLAAIQIGIPLRFAWYIYKGREHNLINPEIILELGQYTLKEGCLSVPNQWLDITRAYEIEYINDGKKKHAKGWRAKIIQHEIGHMNGELYDEIGIKAGTVANAPKRKDCDS